MLNLKKIAVTGGIASGKSTLCQLFQKLGAYVVSADQIVHQLFSQNTLLVSKLTTLLGNEIIVNGNVDRKKVAEMIFASNDKLKSVEKLIHPEVAVAIQKEYDKAKQNQSYSIFVVELPLLFEAGLGDWYDTTVALVTKEDIAKQRYAKKLGSIADYDSRMRSQLPPSEKAKRAKWTIENNGSVEDLTQKATELFHTLNKE